MTHNVLDRGYAAFLFDMDGTLIDSSAAVARVWREWAGQHGVDAGALLATIHGIRSEDTIRGLQLPGIDLKTEVAAIEAAEIADTEGVVAIVGAGAFLADLPPDHWAVVTSAPRRLAQVRLAAAGLPIPAVLIAADDVTAGKPDPTCYRKAADRLGLPIADCLVFEDAPAGIAAAEAAGAACVIVNAVDESAPGVHLPDYKGVSVSRDDRGLMYVQTT